MELENLRGETARLEDAIDNEKQFAPFKNNEEDLPDICEGIDKFENWKKNMSRRPSR